jgi:hypothetical protein
MVNGGNVTKIAYQKKVDDGFGKGSEKGNKLGTDDCLDIEDVIDIEWISKGHMPMVEDRNFSPGKKVYKRFDTGDWIPGGEVLGRGSERIEKRVRPAIRAKIPEMFDVVEHKEQKGDYEEEIDQLEQYRHKEINSLLGEFKCHWARCNGYLFFMNMRLFEIYEKVMRPKNPTQDPDNPNKDSPDPPKEWPWPSHGQESHETCFKKFELVLERLNLVESQWILRPKAYEIL